MSRRDNIIAIIVIASLSILIYSNTIENGFVQDDHYTVVNNTFVKDIRNITQLFNKDYCMLTRETSYRPIATATYISDYYLFGLDPRGYHLTNILLHTCNGILLYIFLLLLTQFTKQTAELHYFPVISALLFTSNPILTEAVNAVSFREDLLVYLFYIGALISYLMIRTWDTEYRYQTKYLYIISCLFFIFALFSKEMAVTFPLVIICLEWVCNKQASARSKSFSLYNSGYIFITLVYVYIQFHYFHNPLKENAPWNLNTRFLTLPSMILGYLKLEVFPVSLSADYIFLPIKTYFSPSFFIPLACLTLLLTISIKLHISKKIHGLLIFGILFFFVTLIPVYNIIPIFNPFAERYLYLPTTGIAVILAVAITKIQTRHSTVVLIFLLLIIISAIGVRHRNEVWKNEYSLWSDTIKKEPYSFRAYNGIGEVYLMEGKLNEAIYAFQTALSINPNHAMAHFNLGRAYEGKKQHDKAMEHYRISIKLNPPRSLP